MKFLKGKGDCETCPELRKNIEELQQKLINAENPIETEYFDLFGKLRCKPDLIRNFLLVLWREEKLWLKALPQQLF